MDNKQKQKTSKQKQTIKHQTQRVFVKGSLVKKQTNNKTNKHTNKQTWKQTNKHSALSRDVLIVRKDHLSTNIRSMYHATMVNMIQHDDNGDKEDNDEANGDVDDEGEG